MKAWLVVILTMLVVVVASAASATSLSCNIVTAGSLTTYTYTLTSTEPGDRITSMHLYSLLDLSLISANTGPANWQFDAFTDPDPAVGADIYWFTDDPATYGIPDGAVRQFSLTVPSWTTTDYDHEVPDCFGNWGYECQNWPGAVLISWGSVPVPCGTGTAAVPEPASIAGLALGLVAFARKLRKSRKN